MKHPMSRYLRISLVAGMIFATNVYAAEITAVKAQDLGHLVAPTNTIAQTTLSVRRQNSGLSEDFREESKPSDLAPGTDLVHFLSLFEGAQLSRPHSCHC